MSATTTTAPSSAKRWAMPRPIPCAAPVTTATFPSSRIWVPFLLRFLLRQTVPCSRRVTRWRQVTYGRHYCYAERNVQHARCKVREPTVLAAAQTQAAGESEVYAGDE